MVELVQGGQISRMFYGRISFAIKHSSTFKGKENKLVR